MDKRRRSKGQRVATAPQEERGRDAKALADKVTEDRGLEISLATLGRAGDFGSLAHYADPAYYELTYSERSHDVDFYVRLARGTVARRVLEYGCGNGRITVPMAQAGAEVTAVDLSKPMLSDFERRLESAPPQVRERIRLRHADMRTFSDGEKYPLIIAPFNTVLHLYEPEEMLAFLRSARNSLAEGGQLVFDVSLPQAADLSRDPNKWLRSPSFTHPETGEAYAYSERFEYDPIRQLLVVWMRFAPKGGETFTIPLAHRQYYPQELRALLGWAGFSQIRFTSDFTDEPAGAHTDSLVVTCAI